MNRIPPKNPEKRRDQVRKTRIQCFPTPILHTLDCSINFSTYIQTGAQLPQIFLGRTPSLPAQSCMLMKVGLRHDEICLRPESPDGERTYSVKV
jgi:hypothetical protein